ncbi:ATP-binding protein [Nonomuraea sp. NPDC050310]|uniref:ATP-binding protein n=1 Tax=unclassified Nonomuraea TaxID=2593643 RepID=UPI0033FF13B0
METEEAKALARALRRLLDQAHQLIDETRPPSELVARVSGHLGCTVRELVCVSQTFPVWEHVNLQRGVDAYLGAGADWFGLSGPSRHHNDIVNILAVAERGQESFELGSVDYTTAAVGPDETTEVITFGLVRASAPGGEPVVLSLRGPAEQFGMEGCRIDVLARDRAAATATRDEIERLMRADDLFRGQILTFGFSEHRGNKLVTFLPRPVLDPDQVVLPEGVLEAIERHVVGIAEHAGTLVAHGQHVKRGLLLHGPPGTGKTHTVRYLMGRLPEVTVLLMAGTALRFVSEAAALARRLQPAIVVLEDVDLVARDRGFSPEGSPLLFTLFDAMDGVVSEADVTFVLTTNRVEILEDALANRPGRVDLAIEVPKPDARARRALLELYSRGLRLEADLEPVVERTEGMTASFFKELLRRTVLAALAENGQVGVLTSAHLDAALTEMLSAREALTRSMLGAGEGSGAGVHEALPMARPGLNVRPPFFRM